MRQSALGAGTRFERPIHTARQRQRYGNVPWDKIEQVSIFASLSIAVSITHASVEHRKKYRCVHIQRWP